MYYDYYEEVKKDVIDYIEDNIDLDEFESREALQDYLYDELFTEDSVTGNGCGSYTRNWRKAWEYVGENLDLLGDALEEFGDTKHILMNGAEACDVTIRCYVLAECIDNALDEIMGESEA